ncbi:MAG: GSCFA domain-containing protein [Pseudomonadota bacterium]
MSKEYNILWKNIEKSNSCLFPLMPPKKLINPNSKICAMGSCFTDRMGWYLKKSGIQLGDHYEDNKLKALFHQWGNFFDPKNLYDCLDRLINNSWEINDQHFAYIKKEEVYYCLFMKLRANSNNINKVKDRLYAVEEYWRNWLAKSDTIIFTLGLIESWIDKNNGRAWQAFVGTTKPVQPFEDRAYFKLLTYEECLQYVSKSIDLVNSYGVKKNIIITVSPIPLESTFREQDVITANRYSKSVLRVVAESVTMAYSNVFYFPALEIVTDCIGWPLAYKADKRHIKYEVFAKHIAPSFLKHFCDI